MDNWYDAGPLTTDQAPKLEDDHGGQEDPFDAGVLEGFAPEGDEASEGEEETGAIPSDLVETLEFASDFGNGRGDDTL